MKQAYTYKLLIYKHLCADMYYNDHSTKKGKPLGLSFFTMSCRRITSSLRISDRICQRDLQCRRASSYQCRMGEMC